MATRSNIGVLNQDGTVNYIYCHFDGYLDHNGAILNEYYTTEDKVRELIGLGDLSILGPMIGSKQIFDDRETHNKNWCLAYGRDRGETDIEYSTVSYADYTKEYFEEYVYLFIPGEGWKWRHYGVDTWSGLSDTIKNTTRSYF